MKTLVIAMSTVLFAASVIAGDQPPSGPGHCPPGTAPQTVIHQGTMQIGPASAGYSYTRQTCAPLAPPPPPAPQPSLPPAPRK